MGFKAIQHIRGFIYYTSYVNSRIGLEPFSASWGVIIGLYFNFQTNGLLVRYCKRDGILTRDPRFEGVTCLTVFGTVKIKVEE